MTDPVLSAKPILERFRLDGCVALVTGGGRGIGRAFAHALGEAGAAVAVDDKVGESAEGVAHELSQKGIDAIAIMADVSLPDQVERMVGEVIKKWGKLTIGVNNAGVSNWTAAEEVSLENWNDMNDTNLKGVFLCAQAEGKLMISAGYGKIINTASMSGSIVNTPQKQVVYNTTKAAVVHLTRSLAAEWAVHGIRVNSISPGYTQTPMVLDLMSTPSGQETGRQWMERTPLGCMADVTDLQGAVVYLASKASDFMTGHDMVIDGGYCVW